MTSKLTHVSNTVKKTWLVILFPRRSIVLSWALRKRTIAMLGTEFVSSEKEIRSN